MDQLLPTRFLAMFKSMNVTKGPVTWKIEESNSQIFVTLIWDSSLESTSAIKTDVGESDVEEVDVLDVSAGSTINDAAVNGQHDDLKHKSSNISETGDFDIEIVEVNSDDDQMPDLLQMPQQSETFDSQEGDDDVIMIDEAGNDVTQPGETRKKMANGSSNEFAPPSSSRDDMWYCGRRPRILKARQEPLSEEEMKWELKRFTLCLRSDMGTRKLPLEYYVEQHRQKLIMLNNWFICRRAEGKSTNRNTKIGKKSKLYKKKFKKFRKRPKFLRDVKMTLTVEEIKHELEKYKAQLLQEYSVEPKELPIDYYLGQHMLRIDGLNKWFADRKKLDEEFGQGVWWKAPALKIASPGGTRTPSSAIVITSTKTSANLDPVLEICETPSEENPINDVSADIETVSLETANK